MRDGTGTHPGAICSAIVWGVWLLFSVALFAQIALFGVNLPKFDEWWDIVPVFTGEKAFSPGWLWQPNFGHRLVLSRLIQIGLLRSTGGDFRAGMVFNALCLVLAALVLLLALRKYRSGQMAFSDVVVPLLLLSWTHFDNVLWAYQCQYLLAFLFVCCLLGIVLVYGSQMDGKKAAAAGVLLLLLPISGFNGLIFVPLTALWLGYLGVGRLRKARQTQVTRAGSGDSSVLLGIAAVTFGFSLVCLADPKQGAVAEWEPIAALRTFFSFLSIGFGVAGLPAEAAGSRLAKFADLLPLLVVAGVAVFQICSGRSDRRTLLAVMGGYLVFCAAAAVRLGRLLRPVTILVLPVTTLYLYGVAFAALAAAWRRHPEDRGRTTGFLALLISSLLLSAAIGLGRGTGGMSPRYATLAAIPLTVLYVVLVVYQAQRGARPAMMILVALVVALAPVNLNRVRSGIGLTAAKQRVLVRAIRAGAPISRLAAEPYEFRSLGPAVLLDDLPRLKAAGIEPYTHLRDDPAPQDRIEVATDTAKCDGVERRGGGVFAATRAGGTVTLPLPHPYTSPLLRLDYGYVDVIRGAPICHLSFRRTGSGAGITPGNADLPYNDWLPAAAMEDLCTTDAEIDAAVITMPQPGTRIRLDHVVIWR